MQGTTPKPFRRTTIAAGVAAGALLLAGLVGPGTSSAVAGAPATTATAGTASATAQSIKVNPTTASLSIGITFGTSLAGFTNQVAQAESRGIDLGIIGSTLAGAACDGGDPSLAAEDQPQPLRADSRDPNASTQKSEPEKYFPLITKAVRADSTPFGQADTTTAGLTANGSFLDVGSAKSTAVTRLVAGTREAVATVDISGIKIAGVIELAGLHWESASRSGTIDESTGTFAIGSLKVLGQQLPTNDAFAAVETANTLLAPLGIVLTYPKTRTAAGIRFIEPLKISVVPSQTRDSISGRVLHEVQPTRKDIYTALLEQDCSNATYITVSDIVIGSLTGAGSFSLELGGAQSKSEALKTSSFLGGKPTPSLGGSTSSFGGSLNDTPNNNFLVDTPSLSDVPSNTATPTNIGPKGRQAKPIAVVKGSRGGRMALVGLLGLIALALVADRDRRLMRRAQRLTATEA